MVFTNVTEQATQGGSPSEGLWPILTPVFNQLKSILVSYLTDINNEIVKKWDKEGIWNIAYWSLLDSNKDMADNLIPVVERAKITSKIGDNKYNKQKIITDIAILTSPQPVKKWEDQWVMLENQWKFLYRKMLFARDPGE